MYKSVRALLSIAMMSVLVISCKSGSDSKEETATPPPAPVDFLSASPWCKVESSSFKVGDQESALLKRYTISKVKNQRRTVSIDYLRVLKGGVIEVYESKEATDEYKDESTDRLNPVLLSATNSSTIKLVSRDDLDAMFEDEYKNQEIEIAQVLDTYGLPGNPQFVEALVSEDDLLMNSQGEQTVAFACDSLSVNLLTTKNVKNVTHLSLMKYQDDLDQKTQKKNRKNIQEVTTINFPLSTYIKKFDNEVTNWCNYDFENVNNRRTKSVTVLTLSKNYVFKQSYSQSEAQDVTNLDRYYRRKARRSEVRAYMMRQLGKMEVSTEARENFDGELEILVDENTKLRDLVGLNDSVNLENAVDQVFYAFKDAEGYEFLVAFWNTQEASGLYPINYANVFHKCSDPRALRKTRFFETEFETIFESQKRVYEFAEDDVQFVKTYQ